MAVTLSKSQEEIREMPLVELAWEILKVKKEPYYFRDLMSEIQALRGMTEEQAMDFIARLYTEMNIDGRFICIGQNVWGLKRWYPVDKVAEKTVTKRFVRRSGDAFSDDDEDLESDFDDAESVDEEDEEDLFTPDDDDVDEDESEDEDVEATVEEDTESLDGNNDAVADEEEESEYEELALEDDDSGEDDEEENY